LFFYCGDRPNDQFGPGRIWRLYRGEERISPSPDDVKNYFRNKFQLELTGGENVYKYIQQTLVRGDPIDVGMEGDVHSWAHYSYFPHDKAAAMNWCFGDLVSREDKQQWKKRKIIAMRHIKKWISIIENISFHPDETAENLHLSCVEASFEN
jgi:hypothetical protein